MNIAVFTNILSPYRSAFFDKLAEVAEVQHIGFKVYVMVGEKSDRPWKYCDYMRPYTTLLKSRTIHIRNIAYIHFNSGVRKHIKDFKPDIVVMAGSYIQPTNIFLLVNKNKFGYKTVFWSESHFSETRNYSRLLLWSREFLRKKIIGKMDAFWYPGKKAEEFVNHYMKNDAIKIQVPNTVNNATFCQSGLFECDNMRESILSNRDLKILFTPARLSKEKGIIPFCTILQKIPNNKYLWLIAGDGPQKNIIERFITDNDLNVTLLGLKEQEEIKSLYEICDLFVLGSISDSNPLSTIEALWMKKPLFLSENVGNYPETVVRGKNGDVFSYNDLDDAANKLEKILDADVVWYSNAASVSYSIASSMFDINGVASDAISKTISLLGNE